MQHILDKSLWRPGYTYVTDARWGDCYLATIRQGRHVVYRGEYLYDTATQAFNAARLTILNIKLDLPIPVTHVVNRRVTS